ncbi:uncharacterized protein EKO05_0009604 [Ascochyta rabiei]|uniref:uncharacterized protein n=1 Tax=Didymella rabiei TaxID=5454 RepID=UPI0021FF7799|nr:uncharacterized protein EKO05_0009604 [Ascochyta rabiei]UPX19337.1 hypothetical protein EKO05_0009604 [Ascochyta rabiei]
MSYFCTIRVVYENPIMLSSDTEDSSSPPASKRPKSKRGTLASSSTDVQGGSSSSRARARLTRMQMRCTESLGPSSTAET